ncbi:hypothetical protein M2192_007606 [Bradyrhizobium elkanii USDA 61]|jgi:hypothetical protein|uniref:Uncharacterized protein n=2 Tax=Bradyrhizobium TaxID=374 RepID=A0A8I2C3F8_BRAEL|nr:hypothetical protein [Bradyrhizobium elkanii]MCS4010646.1 hypothetical protein [Bradyrhizobium elkanii USDA 61]MBP1293529.1 hypothetical protein [Bradyrhizobium elkanii]MCP1925886.1 hypothetical protein [Bradyrhizobium elkanii]MCS3476622.1 hypothetical protein [Bradyrhizobium elkanii]MCS3566456.1 hypothetical protein [Bradyrhizobium elkanii]
MPMTRRQGITNRCESKIPKRKKPRPHTRLSCKIEYFIQVTSVYLSGRSAFFTDNPDESLFRTVAKDAHHRLNCVGNFLQLRRHLVQQCACSADNQRAGLIIPFAYVKDKPQSVSSTTTSVVEMTPLR